MFFYEFRQKNVKKRDLEAKVLQEEQKRKDRYKEIAPCVRNNIAINNEEREVRLARDVKPKHNDKMFDSYECNTEKITWNQKVKEMDKKVDERGHFLDRRIIFLFKNI